MLIIFIFKYSKLVFDKLSELLKSLRTFRV